MALFRRLFYRRPPDGLVQISENILVFEYCLSPEFLEESELRPHIGRTMEQLHARHAVGSSMVFSFEAPSGGAAAAAGAFSKHGAGAMGYPVAYGGCPLLAVEAASHFLRSAESWLALGPEHSLLLHAERGGGGWPALAFAAAALLVYLGRCAGEEEAMEAVYGRAPPELVEMFTPVDPVPSQLRYLRYVARRRVSPGSWPPASRALTLNCAIIRKVPNFDGQGGCRPVFRVYGSDPFTPSDKSTKVLFSDLKNGDFVQLYRQEDCEIIKANIRCQVQGDVVLECASMDEDHECQVLVFRAMFNTAFVENSILLLDRDQIDILWDTKHRFPADFRVEVIFSEADATTAIHTREITSEEKKSLSAETAAKVKQAFSHLDWSTKKDGVTAEASQPNNTSRNLNEDFHEISLDEAHVDGTIPEVGHSEDDEVFEDALAREADDFTQLPV